MTLGEHFMVGKRSFNLKAQFLLTKIIGKKFSSNNPTVLCKFWKFCHIWLTSTFFSKMAQIQPARTSFFLQNLKVLSWYFSKTVESSTWISIFARIKKFALREVEAGQFLKIDKKSFVLISIFCQNSKIWHFFKIWKKLCKLEYTYVFLPKSKNLFPIINLGIFFKLKIYVKLNFFLFSEAFNRHWVPIYVSMFCRLWNTKVMVWNLEQTLTCSINSVHLWDYRDEGRNPLTPKNALLEQFLRIFVKYFLWAHT